MEARARRGSGRRSGSQTTAAILEAALAAFAEDGVDRSTLPRVAERAGTSIGPLYSRFDGTDDLLGALWGPHLRSTLDRFLEQVAAWIVTGAPDATDALRREVARPSVATQATLEALAAVRRYPYSGEAVVAEATAAYAAFLDAVDPVPPAAAGYALGSLFGHVLLRPLLSPRARSDPDRLLRVARDLARHGEVRAITTDLHLTLPMPVIEGTDDVADAFLNAALQVIARGGFEHASSNRIARAAGLSVSRVYRHFDSKHDLAAQALTATIDRIVGDNALAFVGVDRATYEQMVLAAGRALCDPAAVPVRRLRLECVLAARHHPEIHAEVRRAFDRAERTVTDRFRTLAPTGSDDALDSARSVWHLVRNFGFGVLALDEAAHVLTPALDVTPLAVALPRVYEEHVAGPLAR